MCGGRYLVAQGDADLAQELQGGTLACVLHAAAGSTALLLRASCNVKELGVHAFPQLARPLQAGQVLLKVDVSAIEFRSQVNPQLYADLGAPHSAPHIGASSYVHCLAGRFRQTKNKSGCSSLEHLPAAGQLHIANRSWVCRPSQQKPLQHHSAGVAYVFASEPVYLPTTIFNSPVNGNMLPSCITVGLLDESGEGSCMYEASIDVCEHLQGSGGEAQFALQLEGPHLVAHAQLSVALVPKKDAIQRLFQASQPLRRSVVPVGDVGHKQPVMMRLQDLLLMGVSNRIYDIQLLCVLRSPHPHADGHQIQSNGMVSSFGIVAIHEAFRIPVTRGSSLQVTITAKRVLYGSVGKEVEISVASFEVSLDRYLRECDVETFTHINQSVDEVSQLADSPRLFFSCQACLEEPEQKPSEQRFHPRARTRTTRSTTFIT